MRLTPIPHSLDMIRPLEVTGVVLGPPSLAYGFAGLAALWLPTVDLGLGVTVIGEEKVFATRALPLSGAFHDPEPPGQSSAIGEYRGRKTGKIVKKTEELI